MTASARLRDKKLTVEQFVAFAQTRSEEERWELVDGVACMMASPTIRHQLIVSALERALNDALAQRKPAWLAVREIGIELPGYPTYRPEPDVVIVDADIDTAARQIDRFHLAAEVLSDSDKAIDAKMAFYRTHPSNTCILLVHQDRFAATVLTPDATGVWRETELTSAADALRLPEVGFVCRLGDLYRGTGVER